MAWKGDDRIDANGCGQNFSSHQLYCSYCWSNSFRWCSSFRLFHIIYIALDIFLYYPILYTASPNKHDTNNKLCLSWISLAFSSLDLAAVRSLFVHFLAIYLWQSEQSASNVSIVQQMYNGIKVGMEWSGWGGKPLLTKQSNENA